MSDREPTADTSGRAFRFSLRGAFVALTVAAICFALVHYLLWRFETENRRQTGNCFRQIGLALANFKDTYSARPEPTQYDFSWQMSSSTPCSGKPLYSWRFSILPFLEKSGWEPNFSKPWNSFENRDYRAYGPYPYCLFTARRACQQGGFETHAMALVGPGTAFDVARRRSVPSRSAQKPATIPDDTMIVVETANSGLHWMEPGDFDIRAMPRTINDPSGKGIGSVHKTGFHVLFADGTVWYLSNKTPFDDLEKFFTIRGAEHHDRDSVIGRYRLD